jgi:hypothetical protein
MFALRASIRSRKMTSDRLSFQFTRILGLHLSKSVNHQKIAGCRQT